MRSLTIFIFTLFSLCSFGQNKLLENANSDFHRIQIGISVSPDICFRTLKTKSENPISAVVMNNRNKYERPIFGYSSGLALNFNADRHWGIETGLQYSNKGFAYVMSDLTFGDQIDPVYGLIHPTQEIITDVIYRDNFHYLDLPLRVVFTAGRSKLRFVSSLGVTSNVFIKATRTMVIKYSKGAADRTSEEHPINYEKINFSPTASIGVDWRMSERVHLRAEPTFRYGLLNISETPIETYLWSSGMIVTCYYVLN